MYALSDGVRVCENRGQFPVFIYLVFFLLVVPGWAYAGSITGKTETSTGVHNKKMILVKAGCFQMGSVLPGADPDERPQHKVCIDDFYLAKYEVTQSEFTSVMHKSPSYFPGCPTCPVDSVTWMAAQKYCKLVEKRLPTEAEWEYAARNGGEDILYSTVDGTINRKLANYGKKKFGGGDSKDGYEQLAPVGSYPPNKLGIYDMTGNVWEWVFDYYDENYYQQAVVQTPTGPKTGYYRVLRGGGWRSRPHNSTVTRRMFFEGNNSNYRFGFRCAK